MDKVDFSLLFMRGNMGWFYRIIKISPIKPNQLIAEIEDYINERN